MPGPESPLPPLITEEYSYVTRRLEHKKGVSLDAVLADLLSGGNQRGVDFLTNLGNHTLYEDNALWVINKPPGLVVHHNSRTKYGVQELLSLAHRETDETVVAAHRLDKDTSGVLVFTKTVPALVDTMRQFSNKAASGIEKHYLTFLDGEFEQSGPQEKTVWLADLDKSPVTSLEPVGNMPPGARTATSVFAPMTLYNDTRDASRKITLSSVSLVTGRKHQIRATAKHMGMPVVGDSAYNANGTPASRQLLHAFSLGINHPTTGERLTFVAPPPDDFDAMARKLTVVKSYS